MSQPLGMLEPGDRYLHDCGRPLHACLWILRGDNRKTLRARSR